MLDDLLTVLIQLNNAHHHHHEDTSEESLSNSPVVLHQSFRLILKTAQVFSHTPTRTESISCNNWEKFLQELK